MMTWHNIATAGAYTACMIRACRGHALSASYLFRSNILYCWWYVWFTMWRLASNLTKKTWMVGIQILSSHSQAARKGAGVPSVRTKTTDNIVEMSCFCASFGREKGGCGVFMCLCSRLSTCFPGAQPRLDHFRVCVEGESRKKLIFSFKIPPKYVFI